MPRRKTVGAAIANARAAYALQNIAIGNENGSTATAADSMEINGARP